MPFKPGQSGNPFGRARKAIDARSLELQEFCKTHRHDIQRVGEIALEIAVKNQEPWAIKLCMDFFYPKPGTYVAISKEETKEVSLKIDSFVNGLAYEDQQTFLKLWMKSKQGIPSFTIVDNPQEQSIDIESTINNAKETEFIDINTTSPKPD